MAPRLLLVEDNLDYAFLVGRMLRDWWGDVAPDHAARLDDALRLLHERPYDCIVLDLGLPDGEGMQALEAVHQAAVDIPVVVLTAFGDDEDGEEALRHGAQDYLLKERVKGPELYRSIRYAIERAAGADEVRRIGERLELLLAGISDVIVVLGPDGTVPYISPSVTRVLGYRADELIHAVRSRLVHPDDVTAVKGRIRDLLEGRSFGKPMKFRIRHQDGTFRVLEAIPSSKLAEGVVVTLRDVTERERAEMEVAARVGQQAMLADLGRDALHDLDTDALLQQAADGVASTLGIEYGLVLEADVDECVLVPRAASGFFPMAIGLQRIPLLVENVDDARIHAALRLAGVDVGSCLTVIIGGRDRPFGVFVAGSRDARRFSADDAHFVQSVANLLAVAVERRRTDEEIRHQAMHDALTGLPNRTMLADRMSMALADIGRTGGEVALLLMDLDGFKEINDTLGHDVGDNVLCEVATRLADVVRSTDTVARLGGDEFAVLCTHLAAEEATRVATKILGALRPACFVDGVPLQVQGSIGLAFAPEHGTDGRALLKRADAAMYRAKRAGSGLCVYSQENEEARRLRPNNRTDLQAAIDHDELVLHFQPTIEVASRRVVGAEALVRWRHPTRGLLAPREFLPGVDDAGLSGALTAWVLENALAEARRWRAEGHDIPVAVNLAPHTLRDKGFVATVRAALAAAGVPSSALSLEIAEGAVLADPSGAFDVITALWELGVPVSLDDVGTAHPSSAYLRHLPVADLKVDGTIVRRMAVDERDDRVVRSVIELAHDLSLGVVAESVESAAVLRRLGELGCDFAQGFHMAQPVDGVELERTLQLLEPVD